MKRAKIIFHSNCTSSIEGHYRGIKNIINYADQLKEGTSEEFKKILNPLGINMAINKAINLSLNSLHSGKILYAASIDKFNSMNA